MKRILILLGPNLNMTGVREKGIYGSDSAESINDDIKAWCADMSLECEIFQSNHEGALIDRLHEAYGKFEGVIINAGALTHYSYALRDAIAAVRLPAVEVHMSNIFAREDFRHRSVIAPVCVGTVAGFGKYSYLCAITALKNREMKG